MKELLLEYGGISISAAGCLGMMGLLGNYLFGPGGVLKDLVLLCLEGCL